MRQFDNSTFYVHLHVRKYRTYTQQTVNVVKRNYKL